MKTTTIWKTEHAFESFYRDSKIDIDSKNGFSPKALLLSGLAGCSAIDIVEILEKMRIPFASLKVDAITEQTEDHPRVFKTIHLVYSLKADKDQLEKIRKAVDLSLEKYCGVAAMLNKNSPIEYTIELEE
jgi:putative redox protein